MTRPLPRPTAETSAFWEGCKRGELRFQRCSGCSHVQLIPRSICEHCHGTELAWHRSSGKGTILSCTEVFRAPVPSFKAMVPYDIVLVDMDEGFRLMANVRKPYPVPVSIGQRVTIGFTEVESVVLPEAILQP